MVFFDLEYLIFFPFVFFMVWYVFPNQERTKQIFLLIASYYFYMSWDYRFGALILLSTALDYWVGLKLGKEERKNYRKILLYFSLFANLVCILGFFKYYIFLASNLNSVSRLIGDSDLLPIYNIILPAGISFFTFQSLSYTIDVYNRKIPVENDFVRFALFVSFFPQLVAGPIVMAKTFLPQLLVPRELNKIAFREGIRFFLLGYFKKAILSDHVARTVDTIYSNPGEYSWIALYIGAVLGGVQVYLDFSGYSDMAIGSAKLLGYDLPENFRLPFIASSVSDFWRRWHMTLNAFLRDHVYIPLGGSRVSEWKRKWNLWFTMFVSGIWHGANWTFVSWGSWNGFLYVSEEILSPPEKRKEPRGIKKVLLHLLVWNVFFLGAVLFRSHNINNAIIHFQRMFTLAPGELRPFMWKAFVITILCLGIGHWLGKKIFEDKKWKAPNPIIEFALLPFVIVLFVVLTPENSVPFIYFQF